MEKTLEIIMMQNYMEATAVQRYMRGWIRKWNRLFFGDHIGATKTNSFLTRGKMKEPGLLLGSGLSGSMLCILQSRTPTIYQRYGTTFPV